MTKYCIPLERIVDRLDNAPRPLPATCLTVYGRDDILHTPRPSQAAVRDLRVEAVSITAFATVWLCHHDTVPTLSFINSAHAMPHESCARGGTLAPGFTAWLLLGLNKDYSFISLMLQLIKWCQLSENSSGEKHCHWRDESAERRFRRCLADSLLR